MAKKSPHLINPPSITRLDTLQPGDRARVELDNHQVTTTLSSVSGKRLKGTVDVPDVSSSIEMQRGDEINFHVDDVFAIIPAKENATSTRIQAGELANNQGKHFFQFEKEVTYNTELELYIDPEEIFGKENPTEEEIHNWVQENQREIIAGESEHISGGGFNEYEVFSLFRQISIDGNNMSINIVDVDRRPDENIFGITGDYGKLCKANMWNHHDQNLHHSEYIAEILNPESLPAIKKEI